MKESNRVHIDKLDGLRGLAAVTVLVSHTSNELNLFNGLLGGGAGSIGVALFFVLSGYLMGYLYADTEMTLKSCYSYAVKRFARVYPLFFIVVSLAALVFFFGDGSADGFWPLDFQLWLRHVLLISGISVFWTIPVECHFYAVFVFVWGYFRLKLHNRCLSLGLAAFILGYIGFVMSSESILLQRADILTGYLFFVGVFISRISSFLNALRKFGDVIFILAVVLYFVSFPNIYQALFSSEQLIFHSYETVLAVSLLLLSAFIPSRIADFSLSNFLARWCGRVSYSMYLIHLPVVFGISHFWRETFGADFVFVGVFLIFVTVGVLSWASNVIIERPLQRLALRMMIRD